MAKEIILNEQDGPSGTWSGPIAIGGEAKRIAVAQQQPDKLLATVFIGTDVDAGGMDQAMATMRGYFKTSK